MTLGPYDCGQWFANSKPKREVAKTWLMGFLSGMNAMVALSASGDDQLRKLNSGDQAILWMDNHCQANPLKSVTDGAQELFLELQRN